MKKTLKYIDNIKGITVSERETLKNIADEYWKKANESLNIVSTAMKDAYVKQRIMEFVEKSKE